VEKKEVGSAQVKATELQVSSRGSMEGNTLLISGDVPNLHDDPKKVHQLLDLLDLPKGTEVRVITTATSVIVR
jgi:hypothetical protein